MSTLENARERHRRYWEPLTKGEGGYLAVTSPVDDSGTPPVSLPPPKDVRERWLSLDYCLQRAEANEINFFRGQDAIHNEFVNLGPGVMAALVGAPYNLQKDSIWFDTEPPIKNWDNLPQPKVDTGHELYKIIEAQTRALCEASKGWYAVSMTDIGGQMDILFSLRSQELLMDLLEYPDEVIKTQTLLDDEFLKYFWTLADIIGPTGCGHTAWLPVVSDMPWYPIQCDMSVMISPDQFEKFVLPALDRVSMEIGRTIYHLDGPGEIRHLDMLLSLKHVHAIQWVPIPTNRAKGIVQDFADEMSLDVYRRSLAAGKKVLLAGVAAEQVPVIFNAVGSDGMFLQTYCNTRREAEDLIGQARKEWLVL